MDRGYFSVSIIVQSFSGVSRLQFIGQGDGDFFGEIGNYAVIGGNRQEKHHLAGEGFLIFMGNIPDFCLDVACGLMVDALKAFGVEYQFSTVLSFYR
ncbi:MAG: hypothetical protein GX790_04805 [Syntrophomonadaceae bacterium]|nr:hypothetical protein [Syntrophomonadaceae bacterium]